MFEQDSVAILTSQAPSVQTQQQLNRLAPAMELPQCSIGQLPPSGALLHSFGALLVTKILLVAMMINDGSRVH